MDTHLYKYSVRYSVILVPIDFQTNMLNKVGRIFMRHKGDAITCLYDVMAAVMAHMVCITRDTILTVTSRNRLTITTLIHR